MDPRLHCEKLIRKHQSAGGEIHASFGAGEQKQKPCAYEGLKFLWESGLWQNIATGWGVSASGPFLAASCGGNHPEKTKEFYFELSLKDIYPRATILEQPYPGTFRDKLSRSERVKEPYRILNEIVLNTVFHNRGIVTGDEIESLLQKYLPTNNFSETNPPLHILATQLPPIETVLQDPKARTHSKIFSASTTPQIPISQAIIASMAMKHIFSHKWIAGEEFVDGAHREAVAIRSIIKQCMDSGEDPKKLLIICFIVESMRESLSKESSLFAWSDYFWRDDYKFDIEQAMKEASNQGARVLLISPRLHGIRPPLPKSSDLDLLQNTKGLRRLLKIGLSPSMVDRICREILAPLDVGNLPYYFDYFEKNKIFEKALAEGLDLFEKTYGPV